MKLLKGSQTGAATFIGWERLARALCQSREFRLLPGEVVRGFKFDENGLTVCFDFKDDSPNPEG